MDQMSLIVKLDPHNSQILSAVECCWIYGLNHMTFLFLMMCFGQYVSRYFVSTVLEACLKFLNYTPAQQKLLGGILVSLCPYIHLSFHLSRILCPLCSAYSSG